MDQRAPFDLRRPYGIPHGWRASRARPVYPGQPASGHGSNRAAVTVEAKSHDMDPTLVLRAFLFGTVVVGFLMALVVGVAIVSTLGTLRHW
jgi:hypothetical protein